MELKRIYRWYETPRVTKNAVSFDIAQRLGHMLHGKAASGNAVNDVPEPSILTSTSTGITSNELAKKALTNITHPLTLTFLFNNSYIGGPTSDGGSQENEHHHAYEKKVGVAAVTRHGKVSYEEVVMDLQYTRFAHNAVIINKEEVRGRGSGDRKFWQQTETFKRSAAIMMRNCFHACQPDLFARVEGKAKPRKCIEELQAMGFKTMARATTPWTQLEEEKLEQALRDLVLDRTIMHDYASVHKWISWSVLGGTRAPSDVIRKMNARLSALEHGLALLLYHVDLFWL